MPVPLTHVHGLANGIIGWLLTGMQMRLLERFEHEKAKNEMLDFKPTILFAVPTIYVRLLALPKEIAREIGSFVRIFVSGSAPLAPHIHLAFQEHYGHTLIERYGMTETLMNMSTPYVGERKAGTVGKPLPGVSVKLVDENGK